MINETKTVVKVDNDFPLEVTQRFSRPFPDAPGANVPPEVKVIATTPWGHMMWCNEHQQRTMDSFVCYRCEFGDE